LGGTALPCKTKNIVLFFTDSNMNKQSIWQKQLFWGIRLWQIAALFLFYLFFAVQYWLALWYTTSGNFNIWRETLIDYFFLKAILTLPLWWLYFIKLKNKPIGVKIPLHLITAALWIFIWFHSYRFIQDLRGGGYLQGDGIWWDVYIPGLFYCLQFAIFHVYDFYLQTQKQKEKEQQLMQAAHQSEMNALKAQIQPHFLFNTLNSISASVPPSLEHTREMIAQLADTFRYGLRASQEEFVPLKDELKFIKDCLELESVRFQDRLTVTYLIDESLLTQLIPPMLLQPIIENAVKHGIAKSVEGGTIVLTIAKQNDAIIFEVKDTGAGLSNTDTTHLLQKGIGLSNTNKRLQYLFGESIHIQPNQPKGTIVSFKIPYNNTI
jgi:two-component system, LytTR family, sensor kinase